METLRGNTSLSTKTGVFVDKLLRLSYIEGRIHRIYITDIHNRLVRYLQHGTKGGSMLSLVQREVLIPELLEPAVVEGHILDGSVLTAIEIRQIQAAAPDIVEGHVAESCEEGVLSISSDIDIDRAAINLLHLDVGEGDILDQGRLTAIIIRMCIYLLVRKEACDGIRGVVHHYVREGAVTDDPVIGPSQTDSGRPAAEDAVGDRHIFADLVLLQRAVVCTQDHCIVFYKNVDSIDNLFVEKTLQTIASSPHSMVQLDTVTCLEELICMPSLFG